MVLSVSRQFLMIKSVKMTSRKNKVNGQVVIRPLEDTPNNYIDFLNLP